MSENPDFCLSALLPVASAPAADESDALGNIRHGVIPVELVLAANVAVEFLAAQLGEHPAHVGGAGPEDPVALTVAELFALLGMQRDYPTLEHAESIHSLDAAGLPVADVGTGTDAGVTVADEIGHPLGIPALVGRVLGLLGVVVEGHPDVELLHERLEGVDRIGRFGGDGVEAEPLGELEKLPGRCGLLRDRHHAVVHGLESMLLELLLELLDGFRRHLVAHLGRAIFWAQRLSGVELDDPAARRLGLLDRFERGEPVEGVGLAADGEPADAVFGRDGFGPKRTSQGDEGCQSREAENREGVHEMGISGH